MSTGVAVDAQDAARVTESAVVGDEQVAARFNSDPRRPRQTTTRGQERARTRFMVNLDDAGSPEGGPIGDEEVAITAHCDRGRMEEVEPARRDDCLDPCDRIDLQDRAVLQTGRVESTCANERGRSISDDEIARTEDHGPDDDRNFVSDDEF